MNPVRRLLESEHEAERSFVADARASEVDPKGWPAPLLIFHLAQWRGRMRQALSDVRDGRAQTVPPKNTDEFNDTELPQGAGVSLDEAASRSDAALAAIINLYDEVGERPFAWNSSRTTTEAIIRNSVRLAQGQADGALSLLAEAISMRPELAAQAAIDSDLAPLYSDERFRAIVRQPLNQPER